MGCTAVLVLAGMIYLGNILCLPVENIPCVPFSQEESKVTAYDSSDTNAHNTSSSLLSNSIGSPKQ